MMVRLQRMVRNTSFQFKMFIIIFVVILIPMIIISTVVYERSKQAITDQASKVVISSINYAITTIDYSLDSVTGISQLILTDDKLRSLAGNVPFTKEQENSRYRELYELLGVFVNRIKSQNIAEGINSFYLYLANRNVVIDSKSTFYENIVPERLDFVKFAKEHAAEGEGRWFVSRPVNHYTLNNIENRLNETNLISFNRILRDETGEPIAILAVNVNESFLSEFYKKTQRGVPGEFLVLDREGTLIASSENEGQENAANNNAALYATIASKAKGKSGGFYTHDGKQEQFVIYSSSAYTGWQYFVTIPSNEILGKVKEIRAGVYICLTILVLSVLGITFWLAKFFNLPLLKLIRAMQRTGSGDLNVRIADNREDEYRDVYQGFNEMMDKINVLIQDLESEKLLKKEAELKLLQAQINPHFLYNTLDSMYSIAKIRKVEEIATMVSALSKFFRASLSGGQEDVTLKEAVNLVIHYMTILNIRYKGGISFDVDLPESLADAVVPKLILQPIVENAIQHGIQKSLSTGHIRIAAAAVPQGIELSVIDDGVGIAPDELERLRVLIASALPGTAAAGISCNDGTGYALRNLYWQIKLKYGAGYGLFIDSAAGKGTIVTIKLPFSAYRLTYIPGGATYVQNCGHR